MQESAEGCLHVLDNRSFTSCSIVRKVLPWPREPVLSLCSCFTWLYSECIKQICFLQSPNPKPGCRMGKDTTVSSREVVVAKCIARSIQQTLRLAIRKLHCSLQLRFDLRIPQRFHLQLC